MLTSLSDAVDGLFHGESTEAGFITSSTHPQLARFENEALGQVVSLNEKSAEVEVMNIEYTTCDKKELEQKQMQIDNLRAELKGSKVHQDNCPYFDIIIFAMECHI